jgi:hypothetical protein
MSNRSTDEITSSFFLKKNYLILKGAQRPICVTEKSKESTTFEWQNYNVLSKIVAFKTYFQIRSRKKRPLSIFT